MEKITNKDLEGLLKVLERELKELGLLIGESVPRLQQGDKTNGYPFRLFFTGGELGTGDSNRPLFLSNNGFLGWTKREAYTSLHLITDTLGAVVRL